MFLRAVYGGEYIPPPATGDVFEDVAADYWAASWIEDMYSNGFIDSCDVNTFCAIHAITWGDVKYALDKINYHMPITDYKPGAAITRAELADVFFQVFDL